MASMEYVTNRDYIYITGKGDQRHVTLAAINETSGKGQIKFQPSGHKMWVKLEMLTPMPDDSTDNTKNGASAPESETTMATTNTPKAKATTKRSTGKAPVKRAAKATATPKTSDAPPALPPIPPTPVMTPVTLPVPPQSPPPAAEFSPATDTTSNTTNGKAAEMPNTATTIDPLSFFQPVNDSYEICDQHRDGGEDEILHEGEWFKIPGTPIPNGPVTTVCDATVWRAIDDIRRHWTLLRTSVAWLDAWIQEQGDTLPVRADDDGEDFQEYEHPEGVADDDEEDDTPPAPPTLTAPTLTAPAPVSAALNAVQTDLGQATVTRTPRKTATGGGQEGSTTPGPSRIPRKLTPEAGAAAKAWAQSQGLKTGKGTPITTETRAKLPGTVLKAWVETNPAAHTPHVLTWEAK